MNIIIVRNNYGDSALIDKTVTPRYDFLPETAQLRNERPLFLRICRLGRSISERFAHRYYDAATVIPHFSVPLAPNGQSADSELPFAATQGFDNALPTGRYLPIDRDQLAACSFSLSVDGQEQLNGLGSALRFDADHLIAHLSNYHTVRNGDLLLLGAPAAELLIHPEKRVETYLNGECVLSFKTK